MRGQVVLLSAVLLAGAVSCRHATRLGEHRELGQSVRHVVLITVGALRADALDPDDDGTSRTPEIDALASQSLVFSRARAPAPWTLASLASLMTGFPVDVHRARRFKSSLPPELPTIAEHLSAAGYRTAGAGVNVYLEAGSGVERGFDEYHFPVQAWFDDGKHGPPLPSWLEPEYRDKPWYSGTPALTAFALEWLEKNGNRDFFLWLHYPDPHLPYHPPPAYRPDGAVPGKVGQALHSRKKGLKIKRTAHRQLIRNYYMGEVRWVDHEVGRILDKLEEIGIYEQALVVLTGDHGEEFWEHGGMDHGHSLYDEILRVPLLVKLPLPGDGGPPHHALVEQPVCTRGIVPLILDACGVEGYDVSLGGVSLSPLAGIAAAAGGPPPALFASGLAYGKDRESVVFDGWKYIRCPESGKEELYDLGADPGEKKNIAKMNPDAVVKARKLLEARAGASRQDSARLQLQWMP